MNKNRKLLKKRNFTSDQNMQYQKLDKKNVFDYDEIGRENYLYANAELESGDTSRLEESTWEEKNDGETTESINYES